VYRGADGLFTVYEDDGVSQDYLAGRGTWTRVLWNDAAKRLTIEPGTPRGATNMASRRRFRILVLPDGASKEVVYAGSRVAVGF